MPTHRTHKAKTITKRWLRGSLFFTLAVVLVAVGIFLSNVISGYYTNADLAIRDQFNNLEKQLSLYKAESSEAKALGLIKAVEQFEKKAQFELMLVDESGRVVLTSAGVQPTATEEMPPDISTALRYDTAGGKYVGRNENGERVMAITKLAPYASEGVVAIRFVTSLSGVDLAVRNVVIIAVVFLLVIVLASIISGAYFIRSIVYPLRDVEATAARIAQGDFDTRIEITAEDEIGSLCKTINNMAEELGDTERMKNEFLSSVSHELRTPLTSIKGWTETMGRLRDPADPAFQRGMQIIAGETDRLSEMVEQLLDFSRMQSGSELKVELLDLAAEVEDAALLAVPRAVNMGLNLSWETPELPVPVRADKHRVRQVLLNVLDNALKYSDKGGAINVDVQMKGEDAYVVITDEGQGITPEDLENVKTKFYKGKRAKRGSGIGLAVVDEIMRGHSGSLDIRSEAGRGTVVTLRFPMDIESG